MLFLIKGTGVNWIPLEKKVILTTYLNIIDKMIWLLEENILEYLYDMENKIILTHKVKKW